MPYRDAEKSLHDRCVALQNEIAEIRERARELPYLEAKKKNLEHELAVLMNQDTASKEPSAVSKILSRLVPRTFLDAAGLVFVLIVMLVVALRTAGPQVSKAGNVNVSQLRAG